MARAKRRDRPKLETKAYTDAGGNVLTLRCALSRGTLRKIGKPPTGVGEWLEDAWRRRTELLFERLTVSWEIAGLPLTEQRLLVRRYRMATPAEQRWVREAIDAHVEHYFPELLG